MIYSRKKTTVTMLSRSIDALDWNDMTFCDQHQALTAFRSRKNTRRTKT